MTVVVFSGFVEVPLGVIAIRHGPIELSRIIVRYVHDQELVKGEKK